MRAFLPLWLMVGLAGTATVLAQAPGSQPDFSGTYVGADPYAQPDVYPFSADGQRAQSAHDPFTGDPSQYDCLPEDMPQVILWGVTIMQIAQEDGRIVMSVERGDTVRSIHIDGVSPPADQPHTELGFSVGRWAGGVLTVETTHLAGGVLFAEEGFPVSRETRITERYWRETGESTLRMELVIDDPVNYTEPLMFQREWLWAPGETVHPYRCFSMELNESEAVDIEELKRRLEQL